MCDDGNRKFKKDCSLYLQTSDHFYYMCTKYFSDGDVHKYFNPYDSPYDAFINYMNVLTDFSMRVNKVCEAGKAQEQMHIIPNHIESSNSARESKG